MKKILLSLLTMAMLSAQESSNYFVDNFLKYSTFYASISLESPFAPQQDYIFDNENGTFVETTEEIEGSYNLSIGFRKLARFKYQAKKGSFYDGSEKELSDVATIGAVSGGEYLFKWNSIRNFGEEYVDSESWIRYLGDNFVVKGSYANFGLEDLEFGQIDARGRKPVGSNGNFTLGANVRAHPAYGLFPFNDWLSQAEGQWWELAYLYDYSDEFYWIDEAEGIGDYYGYGEDGEVIAESDSEFYEYYYGDLIAIYNDDEVAKLGWQYEASAVLGIDYYRYEKQGWIHSGVSIMPYSKGLTEYSFKYKKGDVDHDCGLLVGGKFNRSLGVFSEARYLSYWGIDAYELKMGINYTFF